MMYNKAHLVATATGASLLATSAGLNVSASLDGGMPAIVAIVAVAIGTLIAVPSAMSAWRDRCWRLALATMLLILAGEGLNGWSSFERILSMRADRASAVAVTNGPRKAAEDRLADAKSAFDRADDAATKEARHGGCRSVCHALREDADLARQEVDAARTALAKLPPEHDTHLTASRIHIDPDTIEVGTALAFSIVLNGLGLALIAIGSHGSNGMSSRTVHTIEIEPEPARQLTKRVLVQNYVRTFRTERGRVPTFKETLRATGLPRSTVSSYRRQALIEGVTVPSGSCR